MGYSKKKNSFQNACLSRGSFIHYVNRHHFLKGNCMDHKKEGQSPPLGLSTRMDNSSMLRFRPSVMTTNYKNNDDDLSSF